MRISYHNGHELYRFMRVPKCMTIS